jgi:hypothetical protein
MSGPTQGCTCLGSAATLTATTPLDPAAANVLQLYMACVAVRGWAKVVLETRGGFQCFYFSCQPSPTIFDEPRQSAGRMHRGVRRRT